VKAQIQGIGVVGGFGAGIEALESVLTRQRPRVDFLAETDPQPLGGLPYVAADTRRLHDFFPARVLRRIDAFSRMAVLAAVLALKDAGIPVDKDRLGIVVASGYGAARTTFAFLDSILENGDACASPTHFSGSVHNAAAAHIAILLGVCGPNLTVSRCDMSMPDALGTALEWLSENRVSSVLVGGVDEWCPVLGHCRQRFSPDWSNTPVQPLDPGQNTVRLAEGAAFFLLSRIPSAATPYGFLESAATGDLFPSGPPLPRDAFLVLGADGDRTAGRHYARWIPQEREVASYTPYYGSLPVGMGFDMAVGSLIIARKRIFPMPAQTVGKTAFNAVRSEKALDYPRVCCLKITPADAFGMILLSGSADRNT